MREDIIEPSVLVVIPTLNEEKNIERVLRQLCRDLPANAETSFVVVDGGSTDTTLDIVTQIEKEISVVTHLANPDKIQSAGINLAVERLGKDKDILVRCDAHAFYPQGYISKVVSALRSNRADSLVVPMDSLGEHCFQKAVAWVSDMPLGSGGSAHRGGTTSGFVDHGHHAGFRLPMFRQVGGYDSSFGHNEDAEFDCRIKQLGAKIYLDASIRVGYWPRRSPISLWKQYFAYGFGRSRTVVRHPSSWRMRQIVVPTNLLLLIGSLLLSPYSKALLIWPLVYFVALAFSSVFVSVARASLCGLLAGPAALIMHISWALGFFRGLFRHIFVRGTGLLPRLKKA